jgi:hypothetical protein
MKTSRSADLQRQAGPAEALIRTPADLEDEKKEKEATEVRHGFRTG